LRDAQGGFCRNETTVDLAEARSILKDLDDMTAGVNALGNHAAAKR
jgi:hypothetical protein